MDAPPPLRRTPGWVRSLLMTLPCHSSLELGSSDCVLSQIDWVDDRARRSLIQSSHRLLTPKTKTRTRQTRNYLPQQVWMDCLGSSTGLATGSRNLLMDPTIQNHQVTPPPIKKKKKNCILLNLRRDRPQKKSIASSDRFGDDCRQRTKVHNRRKPWMPRLDRSYRTASQPAVGLTSAILNPPSTD